MSEKNKNFKDAAICFSGQVRSLELCYPYIKKNLLDNLKNYDIFCYAEDDENVNKIELLKPTKSEKVKSSKVDEIIKPKVKILRKHNYRDFIYQETSKFNFRNIFQQFFKIKGAFNLMEEHMLKNKVSYKYFIRIRFDFLPIDPINFKNLKIKENEVVVSGSGDDQKNHEINDMFCITKNFNLFKIHCSTYDCFEDIALNKIKVELSSSQKFLFLLEKTYVSMMFFLLHLSKNINSKIFQRISWKLISFPRIFYHKFKESHRSSPERILFYTLTSGNAKIKEEKINFVIVRNFMDGLLILR